ncbi:hypothetical protein MKW98_009625 [Papaver atlanticum]|uniref:Uncharacterized protein n=1 Tax=Papaver atlanticum TaxID=357466 RepID=A0AAD4XCB2_9MAGN|nr:hypothetical protein MKW98_009625 [Papaver atlanticum]
MFLEHHGEVSMMDIKGFSQGILVTLAIAGQNIPEGLAVSMVLATRGVSSQNAMLWSVITSLPLPIVDVPSFMCAEAFKQILPFCTGFAAGCMIWVVIAEVPFLMVSRNLLPRQSQQRNPCSCSQKERRVQ